MAEYLVAIAYVDGESFAQAPELVGIARRAYTGLGTEPTHLYRMFPAGDGLRDYRFTEARLQAFLGDAKTAVIGLRGAAGCALEFWVQLEFRESPVGPGFGAPLSHTLLVEIGEGAIDPADAIRVAEGFLSEIAIEVPLLHGGITRLDRLVEAEAEITFIGEDMDEQPADFCARWEHDAVCEAELWEKLRRLYWITLVGPKLLSAMGGASAAEQAGARWTRAVGESLLLGTTENLLGSQDPVFLRETVNLRRWLWPHSIQNPVDSPER